MTVPHASSELVALSTHQPILRQLDLEWSRLSVARSAIAAARRWSFVVERFDSLDELLVLVGHGCSGAECDARLADLVAVARTDELAARIVLQRILPGIASLARRRRRDGERGSETLDEALSVAWSAIREFPVELRPRFVAPALIREIEYRAFRKPWRRTMRSIPVATVFDRPVHSDEEASAADELRALLADAALAGVGAADLELIGQIGSGRTTADLAAAKRVTDRTIRNHRDVALHRIRQVVRATAAA